MRKILASQDVACWNHWNSECSFRGTAQLLLHDISTVGFFVVAEHQDNWKILWYQAIWNYVRRSVVLSGFREAIWLTLLLAVWRIMLYKICIGSNEKFLYSQSFFYSQSWFFPDPSSANLRFICQSHINLLYHFLIKKKRKSTLLNFTTRLRSKIWIRVNLLRIILELPATHPRADLSVSP